MKAIGFILAFIIPALLLQAADHDRAALAEEFLSLQEAHRIGRVSDMWPRVRPGVVKYVAEIFTEDDLRRIIAFYKTPAGKALLTNDPKIEQRTLVEYLQLAQDAHSQRVDQARAASEALPPRAQTPGSAPTPSAPSAPKAAPAQNSLEFANALLDELRLLHAAADQWGIENKKRKGEMPAPKDVLVYLRPGSRLRTSLESDRCVDALGNPMKLAPFGSPPIISRLSVDRLSAVVPRDFWRPFTIE